MPNDKTALIAMSGGVDSSVAAYLMASNGYQCKGVTMKLYNNEMVNHKETHTCCSQRDIIDAVQIAHKLNIPFEVVDFTSDFEEKIIKNFIEIYEQGGTPNPCIDCNKHMKFKKLIEYAEQNDLFYVVTGHYAQIEKSQNRYLLKKSVDLSKDQSYVLYFMTQKQLEHTKFPIGSLHKRQTRIIAEKNGFKNAKKLDSQDICFIPNGNYTDFMESFLNKKYPTGDFILPDGKFIGHHKGAVRYTIGQRKGLNISYSEPLYVLKKDMQSNIVYVGEESLLYKKTLFANNLNFIPFDNLTSPMKLKAKIRYGQEEQPASVFPDEKGIRIEFNKPQRAISAGQAVVLYDDDYVIGGGTIIN